MFSSLNFSLRSRTIRDASILVPACGGQLIDSTIKMTGANDAAAPSLSFESKAASAVQIPLSGL
jgi:hypothetical protein